MNKLASSPSAAFSIHLRLSCFLFISISSSVVQLFLFGPSEQLDGPEIETSESSCLCWTKLRLSGSWKKLSPQLGRTHTDAFDVTDFRDLPTKNTSNWRHTESLCHRLCRSPMDLAHRVWCLAASHYVISVFITSWFVIDHWAQPSLCFTLFAFQLQLLNFSPCHCSVCCFSSFYLCPLWNASSQPPLVIPFTFLWPPLVSPVALFFSCYCCFLPFSPLFTFLTSPFFVPVARPLVWIKITVFAVADKQRAAPRERRWVALVGDKRLGLTLTPDGR